MGTITGWRCDECDLEVEVMRGALMSDAMYSEPGKPTPRERREARQFRVCKGCGLFDRHKRCPQCRKPTEPLGYQRLGLICPGCGQPMAVNWAADVD